MGGAVVPEYGRPARVPTVAESYPRARRPDEAGEGQESLGGAARRGGGLDDRGRAVFPGAGTNLARSGRSSGGLRGAARKLESGPRGSHHPHLRPWTAAHRSR